MGTRTSLITLGLCEIQVGTAGKNGKMPGELAKIGKTYKDTCKMTQDASDVTEHFEEGMAAPEVRKKSRKMPKLTFSIMDANVDDLVSYVGGEKVDTNKWGYDGNEVVANKAIKVVTEQGLDFEIPNGDIEAVINADMSAKGIFLVDFTVTPMAVSEGKALRGVPK
ncbi:hypothetical protein JCM6292_754 [Bacteroides pyogenes JCM 6292]|uniref:Uncharacterized protein n=2 Tax=Bacteroides pyogenes TaxID=310300 RepID=W4PFP5_9BACE|nr:hypothetical protein [Bacteroides pyogenes]GAE14594.1 hypothetical protein JCM6292_754 [Bacteroides pyogenes JCM 6292]GAE18233.1 hypothetical protein JCM6294_1103 [Bacteroides pyogenes DSM 20611 = JCM 6294]